MKIPTCGALRCANGTLRQVYCFLEISLGKLRPVEKNWLGGAGRRWTMDLLQSGPSRHHSPYWYRTCRVTTASMR
jgi:hypothetical protein